MTAPGWYWAEGDPAGTNRYWDGEQWVGEPVGQVRDEPKPLNPGLASAGARIGARIVDVIIRSFVFFLLAASALEIVDGGLFSSDRLVVVVIVAAGAGFAWEVIWIGLWGGTPGKLLVGIRIVDAETGLRPRWSTAMMRSINQTLWLVGLFPTLGLVNAISWLIGLASWVLLFSDDRHRTVMDRIGKTLVVVKLNDGVWNDRPATNADL